MAKKHGHYPAMVESLAIKIIGEQTLLHCTPAKSARDIENIRVPIPLAIRNKMMSKF